MFPLITVIITTHHRPELLRRAIRSVVQQEGESEILVCADEDSDATAQAAHQELRPKDRFLCLPDLKGPSGTRNAGIEAAKGKFICFLDDDDTFLPGYFAKWIAAEVPDDRVTYCDGIQVSEERSGGAAPNDLGHEPLKLHRYKLSRLLAANFIPHHFLMYPRDVLASIRFDEQLKSHEDWDFLLKVLRASDFVHLDIPCATYHISVEPSRNTVALRQLIDMYRKIYSRHPSRQPGVLLGRYRRLRSMQRQLQSNPG